MHTENAKKSANPLAAITTNPDISNSLYMGRAVSYPPSIPTAAIPPPSISPSYTAGAAPPSYSASVLKGQGVFDEEVIRVESTTPKTAADQVIMRNFFYQLRSELATALYRRNIPFRDSLCSITSKKSFHRDGYYIDYCVAFSRLMCHAATLGVSDFLLCGVVKSGICNSDVCNITEPPSGIKEFAGRVAIGLVHQYQDQMLFLTEDSSKLLIKYFVNKIIEYVFPPEPVGRDSRRRLFRSNFIDSNPYDILMHLTSQFEFGPTGQALKTILGFDISIPLLMSISFRTITGEVYWADLTSQQWAANAFVQLGKIDFPLLRRATSKVLYMNAVHLHPQQNNIVFMPDSKFNRISDTAGTGLSQSEERNLFWEEATELAKDYLNLNTSNMESIYNYSVRE